MNNFSNEDLYLKYQQTNDTKYLSAIINNNLDLFYNIAIKATKSKAKEHIEDIAQEASIGFFEGLKRYDPTKGTKIVTHCYFWAKKRAYEYVYNYSSIVRIPTLEKDKKQVVEEEIPEQSCKPKKLTFEETIISFFDEEQQRDIAYGCLKLKRGTPEQMYINKNFKVIAKKIKSALNFIDFMKENGCVMISNDEYNFWQLGQFESGTLYVRAKPIFEFKRDEIGFIIQKRKYGYLISKEIVP